MNNPPAPTSNKKSLVFWVIWAAFIFSLFFYQFTLGHGLPRGRNLGGDSPSAGILILVGVFAGASIFVRWILVPRFNDRFVLLVLMLVGIAMAETLTFFEIFLISGAHPQAGAAVFCLSVVCVLQFAPMYALHLDEPPGQS